MVADDTFRKRRTRSINSDRQRQSIFSSNDLDVKPRRLLFDDNEDAIDPDVEISLEDILSDDSSSNSSKEDDDDERFFTPPQTPESSNCNTPQASDDEMMDTIHESAFDVYLEE